MRKLTKVLSVMLAFVLLCSAPIPTYAATSSKNAKAHKAFQKQLKKDKKRYCSGSTKLKYVYADIDGDKVDELITEPGYGYLTQIIYDYQNGKVKQVASESQGVFTTYYKKKKVIYSHNTGHMGTLFDTYFKFINGKYQRVSFAEKYYGNREYTQKPIRTYYYVQGKKVTKAKYNSYVKSLKKNAAAKNFKSLKWKKY